MPGACLEGADASRRVSFTIPEDVHDFKHRFVLVKAAEMIIQVTDNHGIGWAGAECRFMRSEEFEAKSKARDMGKRIDWKSTLLARADNLGQCKVPDLAPGKYTVLVWARSRDPQAWDASLEFSMAGWEMLRIIVD